CVRSNAERDGYRCDRQILDRRRSARQLRARGPVADFILVISRSEVPQGHHGRGANYSLTRPADVVPIEIARSVDVDTEAVWPISGHVRNGELKGVSANDIDVHRSVDREGAIGDAITEAVAPGEI